jgi:hypothetical protein
VKAQTARIVWVGRRQPRRPWLAQVADGHTVETLSGEHATEALALGAARKEIARRSKVMKVVTPATDEEIRSLRCTICGAPATCVGRYEDMPEPGEPACDECCGHGCEDGQCEHMYYDHEDFEIDPDCRRRADEIISAMRSS